MSAAAPHLHAANSGDGDLLEPWRPLIEYGCLREIGAHVQSLLCRPLDYADHWLRKGSGGGDRCFGVGIITVPLEMREACRLVENDREWLSLELSRLARVP